MTLIIAVQGKDFVVLGADSRGTIQYSSGTRVELNIQQKLIKISDRSGILLSGATCQASYLVEKFKQNLKSNKKNVTAIAEDFASFCRNEARVCSDVPTYDPPHLGFIIAGIDKSGRKITPKCYSLTSMSGFKLGLYDQGFGIEGKSIIAYYLFAKNFAKKEKIELDELVRLVVGALDDTMNIDGDVGGKINMAIIDDSGMRKIGQRDITENIRIWQKT